MTEDCYPYRPPQQTPAEVGRCMMQSRSIGRGKRQATQHCPNTHNYQNDIYQSTPPYRLSSNVSDMAQRLPKKHVTHSSNSATKTWFHTSSKSFMSLLCRFRTSWCLLQTIISLTCLPLYVLSHTSLTHT